MWAACFGGSKKPSMNFFRARALQKAVARAYKAALKTNELVPVPVEGLKTERMALEYLLHLHKFIRAPHYGYAARSQYFVGTQNPPRLSAFMPADAFKVERKRCAPSTPRDTAGST
jgi:hypothetical protein